MAVEYSSGGWPLSSWISPRAALFLLVNVLIGAIVVTSRAHQGGRAAASTRRLCRSASSMVLDRLRSFSMLFEYYSTSSPELEAEESWSSSSSQPPAAIAEPAARSSPVAAAVPAPADGGAPFDIPKEKAEAGQDMPASSDEAHGLALQGHGQQPPSVDVVTADEATAAVERQEEKLADTTMHPAPACRRETPEGKADVRAESSFIRKSREDVRLERLNSIINYTRMLRRGAGAPLPSAQ